MKKYLLIASLFFYNSTFSQADSFFNEIPKSAVYLSGGYKENDTIKKAGGTGFLVIDSGEFIYLVTAEHVARKLQRNAKITLTDSLNKPLTLLLSDIQQNTEIKWTFNQEADVAVLPIHPRSKLFSYATFRVIPLSWLQNKLKSPGRYKDVVAFGFPLRLGVEKYFSAISTSSKVASDLMDLKRFDTNKISSFILLDRPSIPGLSGGPVYLIPTIFDMKDSITLIGLMHGVISDNTGGKFAAIVPSKFIVETINTTKRFSGIYKILHYPNGKLWAECLYEDGYFMEVLTNYSPMAKLQDTGTMKDGSGSVKYYDEKGKLILTDYFKNKKFLNREYEK